ncbi:unnamed protein product [Notodromas monacha]|uniref:SH3 domain-containing protein n=1 Tax=Notodromas monacha TaxID=399045 RepID=A0A7R9BF57_9CRUS|nr:unnamed protein product [Notodromas monacha]CAG0912685.1 unnamed protein product [Notodromas monacha]
MGSESGVYASWVDQTYLACATHSYQSIDRCDLTFSAGEHFLVLEPPGPEAKWINVITELGNPGYVPRSYVNFVQTTTANVIDFLEGCIEAIQLSSAHRGGLYSDREKALLHTLINKRKALTFNSVGPQPSEVISSSVQPDVSASSLGTVTSQCTLSSSVFPQFADRKSKTPPKPPPRSPNVSVVSLPDAVDAVAGGCSVLRGPETNQNFGKPEERSHPVVGTKEKRNHDMNPVSDEDKLVGVKDRSEAWVTTLCHELVEAVRAETNLSHAGSRKAVAVVLKRLGESVRDLSDGLSPILQHLDESWSLAPDLVSESRDAMRLRNAVNDLMVARFDDQQRGWHLHEDEPAILNCLDSILDIMSGADVAVTRHVVSEDSFSRIVDIVAYFQMETRRSIRLKILETLNLLCALEPKVIPVLLSSVLPLELIRQALLVIFLLDIQSCKGDKERASRCVTLLATILSLGDRMPVHYFEQVTSNFLSWLVNHVVDDKLDECDPMAEGLQIHCFILLLGLNLQYPRPEGNPIISELRSVSQAQPLTERLLLHLNRGEDPLDLVEVEGEKLRPDSVVKLLTDMFSDEKTSYLFYTNDVNAMLDMVLRILTDLPEDDVGKEPYLNLLHNVLAQTAYEENLHRVADISKCLKICLCSEKSTPVAKMLSKKIVDRFPNVFPGFREINDVIRKCYLVSRFGAMCAGFKALRRVSCDWSARNCLLYIDRVLPIGAGALLVTMVSASIFIINESKSSSALYVYACFLFVQVAANWFGVLSYSGSRHDVEHAGADELRSESHHCWVCDRIVYRRDHHCFVLGACIGAENQAFFVCLMVHVAISCIVGAVVSGKLLERRLGFWANSRYEQAIAWVQLWNVAVAPSSSRQWINALIATFFNITAMFAWSLTFFSVFYTVLALRGQTQWEFFRKRGRRKLLGYQEAWMPVPRSDALLELAKEAGEAALRGQLLEKYRVFLAAGIVIDPAVFPLLDKLMDYDIPAETVYQILRRMLTSSDAETNGGNSEEPSKS